MYNGPNVRRTIYTDILTWELIHSRVVPIQKNGLSQNERKTTFQKVFFRRLRRKCIVTWTAFYVELELG
jgi:hypothetical protein